MRAKLLAASAIGALLVGPAFAQSDNNAGGMSEQDMQELGNTFEQAGFTNFRPVTGAEVFRGMSAEGSAAVIAVAPEIGNTAEGGTTGGTTGTGMAGSEMFEVTTAAGRTLYIVVAPEMTGMTGATGDNNNDTNANATDTATTGGDTNDNNEENAAGGDAGTTTADADTDNEETTGENTTTGDAAGTTGDNADQNGGEMSMNIELTGAQQVPPVETSGSGQVAVTFNNETRELSWKLDYSDLSSDATAAHFHGPADPGETAPPVVPLEDFSDGAEGSATLTEEQAEQLMAGKFYFNLHTENNPNGEIRGQVTAVQ